MLNLATNINFLQESYFISSDSVSTSLCSIVITVGSIGLTLVLGTLTMKTWRLYKIFVYTMNPGKFLSDKPLAFFVCCMTLVDFIICVVWFVFDPIKRVYVERSRNNLEGVITFQAYCKSNADILLAMLVLGYHAIIMAVVLWLLCSTMKRIPKTHVHLRRSNSILKLVYVLLFVFCFGISLNRVADTLGNLLFEFVMTAFIFQSLQLSFLLLLLLPPILPVLKQLWNKKSWHSGDNFWNYSVVTGHVA